MLQAIRNHVAPFLTVPLAFAMMVLYTGCDSATVAPASADGTPQNAYSGEEIFRGLFLNEGEVAALFPEFWDAEQLATAAETDEEQAMLKAYGTAAAPQAAAGERPTDLLIQQIAASDPAFFDRFEAALTSGNPLVVKPALVEGGHLLVEAAEALTGDESILSKDSQELLEYARVQDEIADVEVWLETYVAVAVAVLIFLVITQIDITPVTGPDGESSLRAEQFMDVVADRLQTPVAAPAVTQ